MGVICDVNHAPETCACHLKRPVTVIREVHVQSPLPVQTRMVPVPVHVP